MMLTTTTYNAHIHSSLGSNDKTLGNIDATANNSPKKRNRRRRRKATSNNSSSNSEKNDHNYGYISESCSSISTSSSSSSKTPTMQMKKKATRTAAAVVPTVSIEEQQRYVALDCEMVGVAAASGCDFHEERSILARVTIVNWDGITLYDTLIRPTEPVINYRTFVSGITAADFEVDNDNNDSNSNRVIDFDTCRSQVLEIIKDKIIVGHGLKNDLCALQIHHPWQCIRDTAKYEPLMKQRSANSSILWPRKLKELVYEYCHGMIIQQCDQPHSSYEDAYAAMRLYQTVRTKWEKVMTYKIQKTAEIEKQQKALQQQAQQQQPVVVDIVPSDHQHHDDISNLSMSSSCSISTCDDDDELSS